MATPTPGTFPSYPPYQPGALQYTGSEIFLLVTSATATAAATYYDLVSNMVGKVPGVLPNATPSASDLVTFLQASSGLPMATLVGNLGVAVGNLPVGGTVGQILGKTGASNYAANWGNLSGILNAGTSIATSGSATSIVISVANAGIGSTQLGSFAVQGGNIATSAINLASAMITGVLPVSNGGIGTSAVATSGILYGTGTALAVLASTTAGLVLTSNGTTSAPGWASVPGAAVTLLTTYSTTSASAFIDATSLTLGYANYLITIQNLIPGTTGQTLQMRVATSATTFLTTNYAAQIVNFGNGTTHYETSTAAIPLCGLLSGTTTLGQGSIGLSGQIRIFGNPLSAVATIDGQAFWYNGGGVGTATILCGQFGGFVDQASNTLSSYELFMTSGTFSVGEIKVYGF